jgi:hypothetical protein
MTKQPNFDVSSEDLAIIIQIAERAHTLIYDNGKVQDRMTTMMDLSAAHNTCPLQLAELLAAKPSDFAHDILGIRHHLNRKTGEIEGHFLPRYAIPEVSHD